MTISLKKQQLQMRILEEIYVRGPISRIDIVHNLGITPATVSLMTAQMIDNGLITEMGEAKVAGKIGRRKVMLVVAPGGSYFVGCELASEAFYFVLADQSGKVIAKKAQRFKQPFDSEESTPQRFILGLQAFLTAHADFAVSAIGIAIPGHYLAEKQRIASDHDHWMSFDLAPINQAFTQPIYYENNVHTLALTQRILFQQSDNFLFLHAAQGIFCSAIHNRKIYGRHNPLVGEIAHTVVNPEGELCDCGRHGCLRTYASEDWIVRKAQLLYRKATQTFLRQLVDTEDQLTFSTVLQAYALGDEGVIKLLNNAIKYLAAELSNLTLTSDASSLILHGVLFDQPDLQKLLEQYLAENKFDFTSVTPTRLKVKSFSEYDGAVGGVGLAISHELLGDE